MSERDSESTFQCSKEQNYRNALLRIIRIQEDCGESYEELIEAAQVARAVLGGFDHESAHETKALQSPDIEQIRERAAFPKDRMNDATWVLYLLEEGEISVGKACEWLRDWIRDGKRGALPEPAHSYNERVTDAEIVDSSEKTNSAHTCVRDTLNPGICAECGKLMLDPFTPKDRPKSDQPSAFDQTSPPLWQEDKP